MSGLWITAFAALTLLVAMLAVVQVGILRRVTAVIERAETAATSHGGLATDGLQPGARIPPFALTTLQGVPIGSRDFHGEAIWLLLSSGCGPCRVLAQELRRNTELGADLGMPLLVVVDGERDALQLDLPAWVQVLLDGGHAAAEAFGSTATPHAFASSDGVVAAQAVPNRVADLRRLAARARGEAHLPPADPPPDLDLLMHEHHRHHHQHDHPLPTDAT